MEEIEIKFEVSDFSGAREKLKEFNAKLIWSGREKSLYFDTSRGRLRSEGKVLRLRNQGGGGNSLTLKHNLGKSGRFKKREELQVQVDDFDLMKTILENLGFSVCLEYEKDREHWEVKSAAVELDVFSGKKFIEIEGAEEEIEKLAEVFGLDWKNSTTDSYLDILSKSV